MIIVNKKIDELIPYENNPRNNQKTVKYLVNSIKKFGFQVPLVIDTNNVIITGHTRYKAAKELEMKELPCIIASDLTEQQIKAFRIIDNKVAELAIWTDEELSDDIKSLMDGFDMTDYGFSKFELSMLLEDIESESIVDEEELKEYEVPTKTLLNNSYITITYNIKQEEIVKNLLGIDTKENLKSVYKAEEL